MSRSSPVSGSSRSRPSFGEDPAPGIRNSVTPMFENRGDLRQQPTAERRAHGSQAPALFIGEPYPRGVQLRLQNTILFAQVLENLVLFPLEPAQK
jgi:hypothetical protein